MMLDVSANHERYRSRGYLFIVSGATTVPRFRCEMLEKVYCRLRNAFELRSEVAHLHLEAVAETAQTPILGICQQQDLRLGIGKIEGRACHFLTP